MAKKRTTSTRPRTGGTRATTRSRPMRKRSARRTTTGRQTARRAAGGSATRSRDALLRPIPGAERREVGGVTMDIGRTGDARVKRVVYPAGFRWSEDMKPITGTDMCMHGHVGFLASGEIHMEYADGCVVEFKAPAIVRIDPGHDGWVVGRKPAVLIEFDFERDTIRRLGLPGEHSH